MLKLSVVNVLVYTVVGVHKAFSTTVKMDSSCLENGSSVRAAVQARWVLDWSLDPCYLGEFSGIIIKLVFIFPLICRIIILICMYLPGLLSQAHFLAVSELD